MSGVLNVLVAGRSIAQYTTTMTRGEDAKHIESGYRSATALTPCGSLASSTFYKGESCEAISTTQSGFTLEVYFLTGKPQTFFDRLVCSLGTFTAASATFSDVAGLSQWSWTAGSAFATSGTEIVELWG